MLPKDKRLNLKREISRIKKFGRRIESPLFSLLILDLSENPTKIGTITSSKLGGAVERNKARRVLSNLVEKNYGQLPVGVKIVLIAKKMLLESNNEEINAQFNSVLSKIHRRY